ncbi:MAG: AAA family ATPase [Ignavibacteria bacterium]
MKISQLEIKNFRSIKHLVMKPRSLCALVGPNSVGKTNILKAIDLVLGEGWTTKAKIARELFYNPKEPIIIEINFDTPVIYTNIDRQNQEKENKVNSIKLEMRLEPELFVKTTINNGQVFYYQENFKRQCHFIYIPAGRNLADELRVSQWTMLGKLMRLIFENYIKFYEGDENKLKEEFSEKIKPAKEFLEKDFDNNFLTFKKFVETFQKYCQMNSNTLATKILPKLNIYNLNWFYKTLQIHVREDFPEKDFDAEEVGAGMQNLLLISIFQTYAELMGGKVIFGIEEPEIFLYPNAQRNLYKSFQELSENTQIFYTTHSPNFIDAYRAYEIEILQKTKERGTINLPKDDKYLTEETAEKEKFKIYTHFNAERNELFFARKVILVEGDADKILWTTICEQRWKINLNEMGVSIIECGGKGGVNYFVGVCNLVGIQDYFAIWDQDNKEDYNPKKDWLSETMNSDKGIEIPGNLEQFLGLPEGKGAEKVKNAYEWAINEVNEIPDLFLKVKEFLEKENEQIDVELNKVNEIEDLPL